MKLPHVSFSMAILDPLTFKIVNGRITEIDVIGSPARLGALDVSIVD